MKHDCVGAVCVSGNPILVAAGYWSPDLANVSSVFYAHFYMCPMGLCRSVL